MGDGGVGGKREAGGGIRKAESGIRKKIADGGLGMADWGYRIWEFGKHKPSQRLSGKTNWTAEAQRRRGAEGGEVGGKREAGGGRELSTFHLKPAPKRSAAFTLIELLGVMAIIGILAAVVLPPMISKIEEANTVSEDTAQATIADAILKGIRANARFPNPNVSPTDANFGWITLAQNFYPGGVSALRYVFPEAQNFAQTERRVYLDPALLTYLGASFGMPATGFASTDTDEDGIPNVEETALRMYIVSSSKSDLVLSCPANGATAQPAASNYNNALINDLLGWVKAYQDPTSANAGAVLVPTSIANWASVGGGNSRRGEYLHVKIVPLESLLSRIQLIDAASPPTKKLTGGNGYAANASVLAQDGFGSSVYLFSDNVGAINAGQNKDGSWSSISSYNDRATYPSPNKVVVPPGNADVEFTLPAIPKYQLNNLGLQSVNPQKTDFYVFSGTSLKLMDSANNVWLTKIIYQDSSFVFREGKWQPDQ